MISFIVPTIGRASLADTLQSIECWPGDEILVVGTFVCGRCRQLIDADPRIRLIPYPPGHDWGSAERNHAMPFARGRYLSFMDDDDTYAPGSRALMADAIRETPERPLLFRMQYPDGRTLWRDPIVRFGNVGTPMIVVPNVPARLGIWGSFVGGDLAFLETTGWYRSEIVWRPEVIALIGDNVPAHARVS